MQDLPANFVDFSKAALPQLLVADDSPIQRQALCSLLRCSGYDVAEAGDGHQVLRYLKDCRVDLLLLDLNMPDGDGFEVLKYLQQHRRALPVVVLSGMPLDQIQHRMHRLPDRELPMLLLKPIDPEQLIQIVEYQLRGGSESGPENGK
jgi:two-component system capsular synthesis sensor histidine kinase RcsC